VAAEQPAGGHSPCHRRERGQQGLDGEPAREGQDRQQVEGEAGLRHRPRLDAPGGAGEADGRAGDALGHGAAERKAREHVPPGPRGRDQQGEV
jgi:hypothetical protein